MSWTKDNFKEFSKKMIREIEENGASARGRKELIRFYRGEKLTMKQSLLANCYCCSGFYEGMGNEKDCQNDNCTIYFFMPYNQSKKKKADNGKVKVLSEEHKMKMRRGRERSK